MPLFTFTQSRAKRYPFALRVNKGHVSTHRMKDTEMIIKDLRGNTETACDNFEVATENGRLVVYLCEGDREKYAIDLHPLDCAVLTRLLIDFWEANERCRDEEGE